DLIGGADFVQEVRGLTNFDQVTWQVTGKDKLQLRYNADPFRVEPAGVSSLVPPESGVTRQGGGPVVTLQWTNVFSGTFTFESLLAYQNIKNEFSPFEENVRNNCIPSGDPELTPLLESYCVDQTLFGSASGTFPRTNRDTRRRWSYSVRGDKFIADWLGGSHRVTFGLGLERAKFVRDVTYDSQILRQELPATGSVTNPLFPRDLVLETKFFPDVQSSESRGNFYAAYITDSFDVRPNLNVTVGLRLSREELGSDGFAPIDVAGERARYDQAVSECIAAGGVPRICASRNLYLFTAHPLDNPALYPTGCALAPNPRICEDLRTAQQGGPLHFRDPERYTIDNYDVEPRFSVAWDPWNDNKTKVSASWGRYVGNTFLAPLVSELGPDLLRVPFTINNLGFKQENVPIQSAFAISEIDRDLKRQYSDEWQIRLEREIGPEMSVITRYVNKKYRRQFQDIDINRRPVYFDDLKNNKPLLFQSFPRCERIGEFADCTGDFVLVTTPIPGIPGSPGSLVPVPDGFPDLELVSPALNSVYLIGNFNESDYEAYIVELVRRFYQNWEMRASYTWSTTLGQAEDFNSALGDDVTNADDEAGPLATDQRHVFTLFGRVFVPYWGGYRVGAVLTYQSGLPYSIIEQRNVPDFPTQLTGLNVPLSSTSGLTRAFSVQRFLYPTGARNDHRNSPFWNLNLNIQKEFEIKDVKASIQLNIFNALNDDTQRVFQVRRVSLGTDPVTGEQRFLERPVAIRRFGRQFELLLKANF
ncbi:MAG: TonB-dependent receptor, partial [Acidobacteria bacterium]